MAGHRVIFTGVDEAVTVEGGTSLLEAARVAGIAISNICGGEGICGRCRMVVKDGQVGGGGADILPADDVDAGVVLACRSLVGGDVTVEIPAGTLARERSAAGEVAQRFRSARPGIEEREFAEAPLVTRIFLDLDEPTIENNLPDCQRVESAVTKATGLSPVRTGLRVMRGLPAVLRESGFEITATVARNRGFAEITDVVPGDASGRNWMAVVDVGTSTVVVHLVDVDRMTTVDTRACFNSQSVFGREVTSRMMAAERENDGADRLQKLVVDDINGLVGELASRNGVDRGDITAMVCSGNTAMSHFLLGLPTENIRREPYAAVTVEPPPVPAREVGIEIAPGGRLYSVPGISGWVGGDLTAGILATGLDEMSGTGMLIDIGTNGEIIIGNGEWLIGVSASAGPALEGASVDCGMIAGKGAIERVFAEDGEIRWATIGEAPPRGICGSGMIDAIAVLLGADVIDRSGQLVEGSHPGVGEVKGMGRFVLVEAADSATGSDIYITQAEIDNVITAKAAIFAAAKIVLDRVDLEFKDITKLFIAGGFGSYVNRENAIAIGLLPDLPVERIHYVGNTSIWGAKLAALSNDAYEKLHEIRAKTTYYDLMGSEDYVEQFRQAMFLPHTDIELFPSLAADKA